MKVALHATCCALFVALALELHLVSRLDDGLRGRGIILVYLAMSLLMMAVWILERRHRVAGTWTVVGAAVLARLVVFPLPAFLSNDIDRYLWDGAVVLAGCDPYSIAAGDPRLLALRPLWNTPVEHLQYPTLYPPLALSLFAFSASFGPEVAPWIWRGLVLVAS
ncbi:MAG: hypothetical protein AAF658_02465, partial [Myxococcota bacterium]